MADRILVDKILKPGEITRFGVALYLCGSCGFFIFLWLSPARDEILAFIYFGGLSMSFLYTGGIGFKYMALGDLIIIITFGPLSVLFAFYSQVGYLSSDDGNYFFNLFLKPLIYAVPLALNTEAILHSNNTRDMEFDKKSGIVTLTIYLGFTGSYILYITLLFLPYFIFLVAGIKSSVYLLLPILTIKLSFALEKDFRYNRLNTLPVKTAELNLIFGFLYVTSCLLSQQ